MKRQNRPARSAARLVAGAADAVEAVDKTLEIGVIGARGDAVVEAADGPIYVPFALPGEQIRARLTGHRAEISEILSASPARQAPVCQHFGRCGGCQLQHWQEAPYLAWKREQVEEALSRRGLGGAVVEETIAAWGVGRRRAAFHAARENGKVRIGFIERGGAALTPIAQCPVLAPELERVALTARAAGGALAAATRRTHVAMFAHRSRRRCRDQRRRPRRCARSCRARSANARDRAH